MDCGIIKMAGLKTTLGKNVLLNRMYKATPDYTAPSQFKVGVGTTAAAVGDTDLENAVPIGSGTTLDTGENQLTGADGGDNSTNNSTIFKPGAEQTDDTAQNLLANNTDASKVWSIADLSSAGSAATADQVTSIWVYIADASVYQKFLISGTCLKVKIGSDSTNYYSKTFEASDLTTGWNWVQLGVLNTNTETGTVSGSLVYFEIEITTNNATDTFNAGDVVYDLLRQYETVDLLADIDGVTFNETNVTATVTASLLSTQAVGFNLTEIGTFNTDATPKMDGRDVYTSQSKSSEDEFKYTLIDGIE
jgi:hypothetical protein